MTDFPPKTYLDIAAYDINDVVQGYRDSLPDDPVPGDNHSPGYRWGWANRMRDRTHVDDGYDSLRFQYLRAFPGFSDSSDARRRFLAGKHKATS